MVYNYINCEIMWADIQTCVCEIDHSEEDHASSKRDSKEEKCLELLSGQPVLQVLQEGIGLEKCKHTWERSHRQKQKNKQTYEGNSLRFMLPPAEYIAGLRG